LVVKNRKAQSVAGHIFEPPHENAVVEMLKRK
jgi:hypothetical protein